MPRRRDDDEATTEAPTEVGPLAEGDRTEESPNADAVRRGELSAAQMGDGNLPGTDVQWPPGRVETAATATMRPSVDPSAVTVAEGDRVIVTEPDGSEPQE